MRFELPCPYRADAELAPFTTFRMGGRVPLLAEPRNREELAAVLRHLRAEGAPFRILGGGANVVIDDRGLDEAVVLTGGHSFVVREGEDTRVLRVGAGLSIPRFVAQARDMGMAGAECLVGIPGTMGGATAMNAGGRHGQLSDIARRVRVLLPSGDEEELPVTAETFGYRRSIFGEELIVLETVVELTPGNREASSALVRRYLKEKSDAQPLTEKSAGCVFKNPPGQSAGRLLDGAGAKGMRVGDAAVSAKHANFIVNRGAARMKDVLRLVDDMRAAVRERMGLLLETEVRFWVHEG